MKISMRLLSLLLALLLLTACGAATPAATETTTTPVSTTATTSAEPQPTTIKNIIVIIGDGMGDAQIEVGELGIFILDGEGYFKKFDGDRLLSLNPIYAPIPLSGFSEIQCAGRVIGKMYRK